jgi:hypothetical protein
LVGLKDQKRYWQTLSDNLEKAFNAHKAAILNDASSFVNLAQVVQDREMLALKDKADRLAECRHRIHELNQAIASHPEVARMQAQDTTVDQITSQRVAALKSTLSNIRKDQPNGHPT